MIVFRHWSFKKEKCFVARLLISRETKLANLRITPVNEEAVLERCFFCHPERSEGSILDSVD